MAGSNEEVRARLPELPVEAWNAAPGRLYTAEQMQDYAIAALVRKEEGREAVAWRVPTSYGVGYNFASEAVMKDMSDWLNPAPPRAGEGGAQGWTARWHTEGDDSLLLLSHPLLGGVGVHKNPRQPGRPMLEEMLYEFGCSLLATPTSQAAGVSEEMVSAVRFAPTSAYWSEKLVEFFGPAARSGIDALDARIRELTAALARKEEGREAVYQIRPKGQTGWLDVSPLVYSTNKGSQRHDMRILYIHPAPPSAAGVDESQEEE